MLSKEQIDQLFRFCEKHHVHHYDLQLELVDHLANSIEEKMGADEQLTFEKALDNVYSNFGVMGFAGVAGARAREMDKRYRKLRWKLFVSYFTAPKIAMTLCLFLFLSLPFQFMPVDLLPYLTTAIIIATYFLELFSMGMIRRRIKKQRHKLLIISMMNEYGWFPLLFFAQIVLSNHIGVFSGNAGTDFRTYEFIMVIITICLISILAYREVVNQLFLEAEKQYPEAFARAD
jgi:hypothetical protein